MTRQALRAYKTILAAIPTPWPFRCACWTTWLLCYQVFFQIIMVGACLTLN